VENNGKVVGSAGVAPLKMKQQLFVNCRKCILPETRGLGIGSQVMAVCLQSAKTLIRKLLSGNDAFYA
jgi:putative acetyltransferase